MSDAATLERPRNLGGRPATGQRGNNVNVTLFDHEDRRLAILMSRLGLGDRGRATCLRDLLLDKLDELGIEDPGPPEAEAEVNAA